MSNEPSTVDFHPSTIAASAASVLNLRGSSSASDLHAVLSKHDYAVSVELLQQALDAAVGLELISFDGTRYASSWLPPGHVMRGRNLEADPEGWTWRTGPANQVEIAAAKVEVA